MNFIISENELIQNAHNKALLNVLIVPLVLTLATMNILFIFAYWGFIYGVYRFVFPHKQLNKLYFLKYLKITMMSLMFLAVVGLIIIVI
ncbi:MAG: hypothetical protein AB7D96_07595 [Arcobacteraceae bacterium]|jgi:amino acid permease